jgi:hypothetical protein
LEWKHGSIRTYLYFLSLYLQLSASFLPN